MPTVAAIIVNFNTGHLLKSCIKNLLNYQEITKIIVVDNNSTDNSIQIIDEYFPQVDLVKLPENKGLSFAYNVGAKGASTDYLLFLGSDAFPQKGTVAGLISYIDSDKETAVSTCKLVLRDGRLDMDAHRGFPTPWSSLTHFMGLDKMFKKSPVFAHYFMTYQDFSRPHDIDACISHFMLVKMKAFDSIKGFDEDYFVYGEDIDFCYRIKSRGWRVVYIPQWKTIHYKGASVGIRKESKDITKASKDTKVFMTKQSTNAMEMFYKKHYLQKYPFLLNILVISSIKALKYYRLLKLTFVS